MKTVLLRNKIEPDSPVHSLAGDRIKNSYEDFGRILEHCDSAPVSRLRELARAGEKEKVHKFLDQYDVVFVELTFYLTWQEPLDDWMNYLDKNGGRKDKKVVVYTGAVDRWLHFLGQCDFDKIRKTKKQLEAIDSSYLTVKRVFDAMRKVDIIGAMNDTDCKFWKGMFPQAKVYWMPCVVPVEEYRKRMVPIDKRHRDRLNLCVHTDMLLPAHAKRGDLITFAIFRRLLQSERKLKGITYVQKGHSPVLLRTQDIVNKLVGEPNAVLVSPHVKNWAEVTSYGWAGLNMMHSSVQGRWQTAHAAMGVPMVASNLMTVQRNLFPSLAVDWYDLERAQECIERLLDRQDFYESCVGHAQRYIDWYGPETQRKRLMRMLKGEEPDAQI